MGEGCAGLLASEGGGIADRIVVVSVAAGSDCGAGDFQVILLVIVLGWFWWGVLLVVTAIALQRHISKCMTASIATAYLEMHN